MKTRTLTRFTNCSLLLLMMAGCMMMMMTSCEKGMADDDMDGDGTEQTGTGGAMSGKTYKVTVTTRAASLGTDVTYPINVAALNADGDIVAEQKVQSAADALSLSLRSGDYTLVAVSGGAEYGIDGTESSSAGYHSIPLLIGKTNITVGTQAVKANILMSYMVTSIDVMLNGVAENVTEVDIALTNMYGTITPTGICSGTKTVKIPLTHSATGIWTTGMKYLLPSNSGAGTTVLSITLKTPQGDENYGVTYPSGLQPATPYSFCGTYSSDNGGGNNGSNSITITGSLSAGEWAETVTGNFAFGPGSDNAFNDGSNTTTTIPTYTVTQLPQQGTVWNGHVVAYIEENGNAMLLSLSEWDKMTSALYEDDPTVAADIARNYVEGDINGWSIPTQEQAKILRTLWGTTENMATMNAAIATAQGTAVMQKDDKNTNVRYLCDNALSTFSFVSGSTITAAGKTVKTYHLRLVKAVKFKV